jgi:hypothetical protein
MAMQSPTRAAQDHPVINHPGINHPGGHRMPSTFGKKRPVVVEAGNQTRISLLGKSLSDLRASKSLEMADALRRIMQPSQPDLR